MDKTDSNYLNDMVGRALKLEVTPQMRKDIRAAYNTEGKCLEYTVKGYQCQNKMTYGTFCHVHRSGAQRCMEVTTRHKFCQNNAYAGDEYCALHLRIRAHKEQERQQDVSPVVMQLQSITVIPPVVNLGVNGNELANRLTTGGTKIQQTSPTTVLPVVDALQQDETKIIGRHPQKVRLVLASLSKDKNIVARIQLGRLVTRSSLEGGYTRDISISYIDNLEIEDLKVYCIRSKRS